MSVPLLYPAPCGQREKALRSFTIETRNKNHWSLHCTKKARWKKTRLHYFKLKINVYLCKFGMRSKLERGLRSRVQRTRSSLDGVYPSIARAERVYNGKTSRGWCSRAVVVWWCKRYRRDASTELRCVGGGAIRQSGCIIHTETHTQRECRLLRTRSSASRVREIELPTLSPPLMCRYSVARAGLTKGRQDSRFDTSMRRLSLPAILLIWCFLSFRSDM